ncbi:hypothetical protein AQUCO_01600326v1 [Aquilegia coerulea]|uniref:Uncharacterized protein n=1 Tax=Aquilegia coerulea TaxID=218851 RepID=A0A2G5DR40_AQUCA|nr:hypothetical protein AQUCO_01600326v1 [Aquilegia coerulea]
MENDQTFQLIKVPRTTLQENVQILRKLSDTLKQNKSNLYNSSLMFPDQPEQQSISFYEFFQNFWKLKCCILNPHATKKYLSREFIRVRIDRYWLMLRQRIFDLSSTILRNYFPKFMNWSSLRTMDSSSSTFPNISS